VKKTLLVLLAVPLLSGQLCMNATGPSEDGGGAVPPAVGKPRVRISTSAGSFVVELFPVQAPLTVANFQWLLREGRLSNTIVHAAPAGEGIYLGRFGTDLQARSTGNRVKNESNNGIPNRRRYLAMIEREGRDSAMSEFVIYTEDNTALDFVPGENPVWGRTVFGRVVSGMEIVDAVAGLPTEMTDMGDGSRFSVPVQDGKPVTVEMTEIDENGNAVGSPAWPTITCPADVAVQTDSDEAVTVSLGVVSAQDAEGNVVAAYSDAPVGGFPVGTTAVNWWAMDRDGHVATCRQQVTVTRTQAEKVYVRLRTTEGNIVLELDPGAAPITVENFLEYVNDGFYNGVIFHRVAQDPPVIQAGAFLPDGTQKAPTYDPIVNEADNGLSNVRGAVAMARTDDPDSATSQFYINVLDNPFLDAGPSGAGYAVFGRVVDGIEVVDRIHQLETVNERPVEDVIIESAEVAPTVTTASGLKYQDFAIGDGPTPPADGTVRVNYYGFLEDGTQFDAGEGSQFRLTGVIAGFAEGIRSMAVGGTRRLVIPPELGYGQAGNPPTIPPNATLIFIVDLLEIVE